VNRPIWIHEVVEIAFESFVEHKWRDSLNVTEAEPPGMNVSEAEPPGMNVSVTNSETKKPNRSNGDRERGHD
jgi:hypothetical protein